MDWISDLKAIRQTLENKGFADVSEEIQQARRSAEREAKSLFG